MLFRRARALPTRLPRALAAFAPLIVLLAAAPSALATPFTLVISNTDGTRPATVTAGQDTTVKAKITNLDSYRTIRSANLTAPSGLQVVSATPGTVGGTATVSGSVVQLRYISIPKGTSRDLTITLRASGSAGCGGSADYTWPTPAAKEQGNFTGTSFHFRSSGSDLRTRVIETSCALRFFTQPANARTNEVITGTAYDPGATAVSVEVVDGSGQRVTSSTAPVTVRIGTNPSGGTLSGTKTVSASGGLATFSTLSIDKIGQDYTLVAESPGLASATSSEFDIDQFAVRCVEDVDCTFSAALTNTNGTTGGSSSVSVTALQGQVSDTDTGFLTGALNFGGALDCSGYTELTSDVIAVSYSSLERQKRVVATISKQVMQTDTNNGASFLSACFGAPYTFGTKPGTPLEVNGAYVPGPYPPPEFKGLLPDCGGSAQLDDPNTAGVSGPVVGNAGPPCVVKRKKVGGGQGFIESLWPSGEQVGVADPRGRY
jgi:hypothetical protein